MKSAKLKSMPPRYVRDIGITTKSKLQIIKEAWSHYQMALKHQQVLKSAISAKSPLRKIADLKSLRETLTIVEDSLAYQVSDLKIEMQKTRSTGLSKGQRQAAIHLIAEIETHIPTSKKREKIPQFEMAYKTGFDDGVNGRKKNCKPALIKSVISESYRTKYGFAYNDGFYAGIRERRKRDLSKVSVSQSCRERNNGRSDNESR